MLALGLVLLAAGILAVLGAVFSSSGSASFFGIDLGATTVFFLGVAATLAWLCGLMLTSAGTRRALRHRRAYRRLRSLERERGAPSSTASEDPREDHSLRRAHEQSDHRRDDPPAG
jgi:uncharacterized integral membrane protein